MKKYILLLLAIWSCLSLNAQPKIKGYNPELEPYISFINEQHTEPLDYLLNKYTTHDVIVFGERDHRDITQYYFIEKLINTEAFYKQVGVIYTETGSSNYNDTLNKILQNRRLSEAEIDNKLIEIYREISYQVFWEKHNFFYLWKTIYKFNQLHPDYPIELQMTSHPFDWSNITDTAVCRAKTNEVEQFYDESMADYFLNHFKSIQDSSRNKAFVIMNYPHSLRKWASLDNVQYNSMFGSYIDNELGDRVCYLIANPYIFNTLQPLAHGKWDAAFKYCQNKTIGFDFKNSPFGKDTFDVWSENGILSFEELYDGMLYINPISECQNVIGLAGFLDKGFSKEYMRRVKLRMYAYRGKIMKTKTKWEMEYCNDERSFTVEDNIKIMYGDDNSKSFETIINQWLLLE